MAKKNLIVICQSGGKFTTSSDGSLLYTGGEAHAITVNGDSKFDELKSEMADMWKYDPNTLSIKYLLPNNKKTLITISSGKDIKRMLDFHEDSATVDVFVMSGENQTSDIIPAPRARSRKTTATQSATALSATALSATALSATPVTPRNNLITNASASEGSKQLNTFSSPASDAIDALQLHKLILAASNAGDEEHEKLLESWKNAISGLHQQFNSVHDFRDALRKYSIAHGFTYSFKKNESRRVTVNCKGEGCPWRIHASRVSTTQLFRIKKINETHICGAGTGGPLRPQASRKLLASIVKEKLLATPNSKPKEIAEEIRQEFGIELRYCQAWRGIETARKELHGSCKEAYNNLPWLCQKIVETNPGSVVTLITREDSSFHHLFIALHASLHGFQNGCRPLIFLDTLTVKSKFQSELLTATALDGNDGFFPVAFAIVDVVNDETLHWFLMQLKSAIPNSQPITFVADRQMGLRQSIPVIFENSYHAYCLNDLTEELIRYFEGSYTQEVIPVVITHMHDAARATTLDGFRKCIQSIKNISPEACEWIVQSQPEHWANALFEGSRYNYLTSDIAKSFYSWVSEFPVLPVVQIIDTIRCKIMELIYSCRVDSNQWLTRLTPSVEDKLQKEILKAHPLQVLLGLSNSFEVHDGMGAMHVVNVDLWDCSCREWQLNGFPCFHAVAVLQHIGNNIYDYCSKYFTTEFFRVTYSESVNPVPTTDKPGPNDSSSGQVLPPSLRRLSGPPKKRRIRSRGVVKRPLRCSKCNGVGHNRATCHVYS